MNTGWCKWGDKCRFSHVEGQWGNNKQNPAEQSERALTVNLMMKEFEGRMKSAMKRKGEESGTESARTKRAKKTTETPNHMYDMLATACGCMSITDEATEDGAQGSSGGQVFSCMSNCLHGLSQVLVLEFLLILYNV